MTNQEPLRLEGCRHDVLGHYLKAIGLLRVLAKCANQDHCDAEAEGWWDTEQACFCLRSTKYPKIENFINFLADYYRPTPVMAAWNKKTGSGKETSDAFCASSLLGIAEEYSSRVVTTADRKKIQNKNKLTSAEAFRNFRDDDRHGIVEVLDAIAVPRFCQAGNNPVFLGKGSAGRAHLFRSYWHYLGVFAKLRKSKKKLGITSWASASLTGRVTDPPKRGKGTPFFPDAIKSLNTGTGWTQENYPFNGLDYILAMEGALALRGSTARAIGAKSRRFAAFPFVFESGDDMVDKGNKIKGTASVLWLPLWRRTTTFAELSGFICDSQARLPKKDVRFSAEFARALHTTGVDAGFCGWQEFRFKMRGSEIPWITTGKYIDTYTPNAGNRENAGTGQIDATRFGLGLAPLDESRFLDQFAWRGGVEDQRNSHAVRSTINSAMENASHDPSPVNCLAFLESIFSACRLMCASESFRKKLPGQRATFFSPLPMKEWDQLLRPLADRPEFRIARAIASIRGSERQSNGGCSNVQPMLGSLLPLAAGRTGWYLPNKGEQTHQHVWTGANLSADLAKVFGRRYLDSLKDDRPAIFSPHGADLADILAFLNGSLDDLLIARWTEALSLVEWQFQSKAETSAGADKAAQRETENSGNVVDTSYAALRTLLEVECEKQVGDPSRWKKRRSQQPIALLCTRSAPSLSLAVSEALRWISIWGVPNPWGPIPRAENPRLEGKYVIRTDWNQGSTAADPQTTERLAAAVCIPLRYQDRWKLFRAVTLPAGQ